MMNIDATGLTSKQTLTGVLLDESALTVDELARACQVEPDWVVRHVEAGVLGSEGSVQVTSLQFRSLDLDRARRLLSVERDFDANEDLAALVIDLADEVRRLRARLHVLGVE
jgi:chaperone modulatory protein CbpM